MTDYLLIKVNKFSGLAPYCEPIAKQAGRHPKERAMFIDEVVLAGVVTVGLMIGFLGAVGYFVWKDAQGKRKS